MKKKLLALFLCCALSFGLVTAALITPASADTDFMVYQKGTPITVVELPENGSVAVEALLNASASGSFQWQIMARGVWANVIGATGSSLTLRYAMLANVLNGDGQASVRCRFTPLGAEAMYSNTVTVQMIPDSAATVPEDDAGFDFTVLAPGSVVEHETAATANETPAAPTENTAPAGDAAIASNGAATGYALVPPAEPVPAGDADVPSDEPALAGDAAIASNGAATGYALVPPEEPAPANDTPDIKQTYNIVINYQFENGTVASDSYTATLAEGESFSATVTFPTVQGYLPYVNETQQNSLDLNYTAIDKDYTYNVVYKPTNVDYTVIHYWQNKENDEYTEVERETLQGLTGTQVDEAAKEYLGFYALLYEKPAIAADGSTVVEVYYDRYYYLMNLDLDGGYGVEPIYARYGAPIGDVGTPTKAGYTFDGWSLDGSTVPALPTTMPAENRTYKAVWTADDTAKVTVVFWGENADDEDYSYLDGYTKTIQLTPGTEFTYSESGMLDCALEAHTHDDSCGMNCGHTHTAACYGGTKQENPVDGKTNSATENINQFKALTGGTLQNGMVYRVKCDGAWTTEGYDKYYLYYDNNWYLVSSSNVSGSAVATSNKMNAHKHSGNVLSGNDKDQFWVYNSKLTCTHTHTDSCYNCGKTAHTHNSDCYLQGAGLDSSLWKFVRSDTVTVAANGSSVVNVYYDRTEKTLTFKYDYSNRDYQSTETITAKWGANIAEQYKKIAANAGSTFWSAETSGDGPYTNYFSVMPQTSATYYNRGASGDTGTMTYWGQDLNGDYTVKLFEVTGVGGYTVTDEDRYEFQGYTYHHGTSNGSSCSGATFYYTRNSYTLTFNDGYNDVKTESVLYEAPLSTYSSYVPEVPSAYEPGSVTFGGWYLNPECTGAEYKLNEHTMPADNVLLYAKWVPVDHTVEFYLDHAALDAGTKLSTHPDITVPQGSKADPTPTNPTNGSYTLIGWFYMENGVEKAFDFANMPVTKDMKVYGKWSSNVLKQYTIYYKIQGTDTEIAAPTTGSGLAGVTKTFEAKGGADLYADYQEGYFPVTKSHSLTIDINATEENDTNVYTFWYVQKEAVPYTVKYLNRETGEPVATEKTVSDNRKAVVTATFVPVSGMMPDAYQKRLVVSAEEGAVNEIIFYYTEDTTHAYYKITHYTENLAKDAQGNTTWTEYASSQAVGDIGTTYPANPMTIPGFTYDSSVPGTVASGELTANGLELKLYYTRNSYPYQVRYLEQGSGKQLANPKNGTGKYGQVVSENAIDITNYTAVAPTSQTLNIRIEESQTEAKLNIITFYYTEKEVTINYVVVGPDGCGTVSPASETLKVLTGTAQGSTPTANSGFRFVGWYTDEACTTPVTAGWVDANNKLTPVKTADAPWTNATYYAKFEYDVADLTITKSGCNAADENQCFIFTITGPDGYSQRVVINGNGSVTIKGLKAGTTYTVTEDSGWSWRYKDYSGAQTVTLEPGVVNNVAYTNQRDNPKWLGGDAYSRNIFGTLDTVSGN